MWKGGGGGSAGGTGREEGKEGPSRHHPVPKHPPPSAPHPPHLTTATTTRPHKALCALHHAPGADAAPLKALADEVVDWASAYFPIAFNPPPPRPGAGSAPAAISRQQLAAALEGALAASPFLAGSALPLMLEKLSSTYRWVQSGCACVCACLFWGSVLKSTRDDAEICVRVGYIRVCLCVLCVHVCVCVSSRGVCEYRDRDATFHSPSPPPPPQACQGGRSGCAAALLPRLRPGRTGAARGAGVRRGRGIWGGGGVMALRACVPQPQPRCEPGNRQSPCAHVLQKQATNTPPPRRPPLLCPPPALPVPPPATRSCPDLARSAE